MKCSCGGKNCRSRIVWDTGSKSLRATKEHTDNTETTEVLLYYDANALVELSREIRKAMEALLRSN